MFYLPIGVNSAGNLLWYFGICLFVCCFYPIPVGNSLSDWRQVHHHPVIGGLREKVQGHCPFQELQSRGCEDMHSLVPRLCSGLFFLCSGSFPGSFLRKERNRWHFYTIQKHTAWMYAEYLKVTYMEGFHRGSFCYPQILMTTGAGPVAGCWNMSHPNALYRMSSWSCVELLSFPELGDDLCHHWRQGWMCKSSG